jgi:hypothetical protein
MQSAVKRRTTMDMRRFSGEHYIKVAEVRDGPIHAQIAAVKQGKFDKPDLVFETGDVLSLNATNSKILLRAFGPNSEDWIGKQLELFLGEVQFQQKVQEAVIVRPISPPLKPADQTKLPPGGDDMNDQIPF